ncbi:MAG TPA: hypothetical protein VFF12_03880 [Myxococcaceae bacterium]|nr:hypothetical protein [Myxococcaceae bacterium]
MVEAIGGHLHAGGGCCLRTDGRLDQRRHDWLGYLEHPQHEPKHDWKRILDGNRLEQQHQLRVDGLGHGLRRRR